MAENQMQRNDTMDGGEQRSGRAGSLLDESDADLDALDAKITRVLDQMDAQQKRIKHLEAALQREIAEKNELEMQNQRLQRTLEGLVGRLEMDDPTREGILKMLTSKTMELREESPKAGKKLQNKVKEQILAIKQFQVELQNDVHQQMTRIREQIEDFRMTKLHEFESGEDIERALRLSDNIPHMLPVAYFVKARERSSSGFVRLFGYPWNNPVVWFGVIPDMDDNVWIYIWANPLESIAEETLKSAIKQFSACYEIKRDKTALWSPSKISEKVIQFCNEQTKRKWECDWSYQLFYMNEEQQKRVTQMKLELPSLYRFDDVNRSSDARILERNETNIEVLREWFECMPCVAVRSGNKLTGVRVSTPLGFETFSSPSRKIRSALEMRVWQECISKKFWPFELVRANDEDLLKEYNESDLWTRLDDNDDNPIILNWID